ncbi:MAG: pyridoxine 5'-phosphate synthase [candidate division Zixibacteria bacterium]|nr:pyridoxine 5'-phosphate synthase [candidate division Zixibacteria bacterium]
MARITVILDEVINLAQYGNTGEPNPAKAAALCELAGAGGVALQMDVSDITPRYERTVKSVKDVLGIPLALIMPAHEKAVEKTIELSPNMAVLNDYIDNDDNYITRLQIANIVTAVKVLPEIAYVKTAAKRKADYIAIDTTSFCEEKSLSIRVDILNNISKAAALAERLSMGVIAAGPLTLADIDKLARVEQIEDFFIGHELISKAVLFGFEKAIAVVRDEIGG